MKGQYIFIAYVLVVTVSAFSVVESIVVIGSGVEIIVVASSVVETTSWVDKYLEIKLPHNFSQKWN